MQLPNFTQAVRSVLYWRLYSAILTVGLLAHSCMACQAIRNQRTYFVIRVDDQGQAFVSNPLDWWDYQRPQEKEAVAVASLVAQLLLDSTSDSFDKQFDLLRKRQLIAPAIARAIESQWARKERVRTEKGEVEMTYFEMLKRTGMACDVRPEPGRWLAREDRDGSWDVRLVVRRECSVAGSPPRVEYVLARIRLEPMSRRTYENPHGLIASAFDFQKDIPPDYDPRSGEPPARTTQPGGTP